MFHFLAFPLETDLLPSLIWWADQGGTTVTACWLPSVCTVGAICDLLELSTGQIDSLTAESDGIQQIATDRFKPRVGRMIWLRPADHLEEDDEIELMQQPRPTVSPNLVPVRFLGTHSTSVQVNIRNDESIMQQLRDDWPLMGRIAADLYALHLVSSPPTFVTAPPAEVYLLQFHADASDQIHPDDVLILLTVSFSAPHSIVNNKQRIRVVWGPKKTTRDQFLSYVRMQRHCASATVLCVLFHNNSPWAIQDSSLRNLREGDHLRLQIRSDKEGWCDFEYSEESARRMRVFTDSPPDDRSEASEHDESLSPYSVRSRSRERSRSSADVHRGPQSPADIEDDQIEETDSDSLLQVMSRAFRLTDPTSLTVANPHVIDLWCEKWLRAEVEPVLGPCPDVLGINSYELVIKGRRSTDGDGQSKSKLGIQMEHLYVLIAAIGIVCYRVYLDCCRTTSTSLVKVQGVRHVQRRRLQRDIRFGVYIFVALLICQHCVEAQGLIVHGRDTLLQKKDNYENVDIWTSTFARLPPPGNGAAGTEQASRNALSACDDFSEAPSVTLRDATQCCESEPRRIDVPSRVTISLYELLNGNGDSMDLNDLVAFDLHENTRACIDQWGVPDGASELHSIVAYTDGSAGVHYIDQDYTYVDKASWAFAVWLRTEQGCHLLGVNSGHVEDNCDSEFWYGVEAASSAAGERSALLAAAIFVLRLHPECPVEFHFDSTTAGFGATGRWNSGDTRDANLLRCVMQILELRLQGRVQGFHVKGHSGDPYNELVNTLAYDALQKCKKKHAIDFRVSDLIDGRRPLCSQWPTVWQAQQGHPGFPKFVDDELHWLPPNDCADSDIVWKDFHQEDKQEPTSNTFTWTVATLNVRTKQDSNTDKFAGDFACDTALLTAQFVARSADIVLLQETRHRDAAIVETADYTKFLSPAKHGNGGVAVWIGKKTGLAKSRNYVILAQAHDCLLIRFEFYGRPLFILSAHGPHSGYSKEDIAKWWSELQQLLMRFDVKGRLIAGIDANAHFSFPIEAMIGITGIEERGNYAAACFVDLLTACDAWLPASFPDIHYGITATWRHPARGTWHRCDYVVLSMLGLSSTQSWADANVDPGGANIDHLASFAKLQIEWRGRTTSQTLLGESVLPDALYEGGLCRGKVWRQSMTATLHLLPGVTVEVLVKFQKEVAAGS